MNATYRAALLSILATSIALLASCSDSGAKTNPFLWTDLRGTSDFVVAADGRVVVVSEGRVYGTLPGVDRVDPDSRVVTGLRDESVRRVELVGSDVFLMGWSSVSRMPVDGGPATVVDGPWRFEAIDDIHVDATHLFVARVNTVDPAAVNLYRHDLATGEDVSLVTGSQLWGGLVGDADHVYFITYDHTIDRVPKAGGPTERLFVQADHPELGTGQLWALALDETHVYVAMNGAAARVAKSSGEVEVIATDDLPAGTIAVDATHVYWSRGLPTRAVDYPGECEVLRRALEGGPIEVVASGQNGVTRIGFTQGRVIWNEWVPGDLASARLDAL